MTFSPRLATNVALHRSSDSFPNMVIYMLCAENCQNYYELTKSQTAAHSNLFLHYLQEKFELPE